MSKSMNSIILENNAFKEPSQGTNIPKPKELSILMRIIVEIISTPCQKLSDSPFRFERTHEAAQHNSQMILNHGGDLEALLNSLNYSFTHYGSEFRSTSLLEKLLSSNSKWADLKSIINAGVDYEMNEIKEDDR